MTATDLREKAAKRFLVVPGEVRSKSDGEWHYIDANRLIELYGVKRDQCAIMPEDRRGFSAPEGSIALYPRYHGDYREWLVKRLTGSE